MADNDKTPKNEWEYYREGEGLARMGDIDGAIDCFDKAIHIKSDFFEALKSLGIAWSEIGNQDNALTSFGRAIDIKRDDAEVWYYTGLAWSRKGDQGSAINHYTEAIRLKADYAAAWKSRGLACLRQNSFDEAINNLDEAIRLEPNDAEVWNGRGLARSKKNQHDAAIMDFNEAIRIRPNYVKALKNRGFTQNQKGEYSKASADFDEAARLESGDKNVRHPATEQALKDTEAERKELAEHLKKEYEERLEQELEAAVGQITTDTKAFRNEEKKNMCLSGILRILSIFLLVSIAFGLFFAFKEIYRIETQGKELEPVALLSWLPAVTTISTPFFLLWWMLQRWSFELKTLAYGFQRKAIVEERILLYFRNEPERLKKMQEIYLVHWMEKSPLEVMLAIGGKSKGMGGSSLLKDLLPKFMSGVVDSQK